MISQASVLDRIGGLMAEKKFFVVSLYISSSNKIRLIIDSQQGVQIDDCVMLRGIDSPFRVKEQYTKNIGRQVEVLLKSGHTYQGVLLSADKTSFCIEVEKKQAREGGKKNIVVKEKLDFVYDEVSRVRVVITF
jgi:ribosome maturation factor RimP